MGKMKSFESDENIAQPFFDSWFLSALSAGAVKYAER